MSEVQGARPYGYAPFRPKKKVEPATLPIAGNLISPGKQAAAIYLMGEIRIV